MSNDEITLSVVIEFESYSLRIQGEEARKWQSHNDLISLIATMSGQNPFNYNPIKWEVIEKDEK